MTPEKAAPQTEQAPGGVADQAPNGEKNGTGNGVKATRRRPGRKPGSRADDWEVKRRRILDVAAEVFFTRGYERGTTKEIAERAGMSQPTIYHYVGSKEVLMTEIARQVDRDFTGALDDALAEPAPPEIQLRRMIEAFVRALALNQRTFAVYWKEFRSLPKDVGREVSGHERDFVVRVEEVVARAQEQGILPSGHPTRVVSEGILGMMSWMHWWFKPDEFDADQVAAAFCDLIGLPPAPGD
ncbi:TetR/AcrR family transcriptional regulator [Actinomadura spongiicola]|uniref:TetR/AcrR family transcriptional regulator n=1 Tax=Actinomadura spongiicola TaxID=2303421 RepID=A0A372G9C5_9ACTN|nr:TetR/AcrR family transcriptional regulator [Actinomadura spongiicola]RFS81980.1 TetR/AcrR family transcriptional regulator [Actinomadura spongiicola]